jgi:hypothetical protein
MTQTPTETPKETPKPKPHFRETLTLAGVKERKNEKPKQS